MCSSDLKNNEVNKIILTRPAIEAGEKLGFLPGDLQENRFSKTKNFVLKIRM